MNAPITAPPTAPHNPIKAGVRSDISFFWVGLGFLLVSF